MVGTLARQSSFVQQFSVVEEPRIERSKRHLLIDILFLAVCATIAGAEGPTEIEMFGKAQEKWLRRFIKLPNGIPSHDTIGRVFALLKPDQFQQAFLNWIGSFCSDAMRAGEERHVCIDGKTLCGSGDGKEQKPLHLVSAWVRQHGITLGQVAVDGKSNEITAIPELLRMLELRGAIVTIDAMGCQKEIAAQIVDGEGDYVLALKDNHPTAREAVEKAFLKAHEANLAGTDAEVVQTEGRSRGRNEERTFTIMPLPKSLLHLTKEWKGLRSIGQAITTIEYADRTTTEVRYFLSSLEPDARKFAECTRGHWSIESSLHWVLDVVFGEDASQIYAGHAAANFSFLRKFVISLLKRDTSRGSLKGKRKTAGWNVAFLEKILFSP